MIGALGSHFTLSATGTFVLSALTGVVMLLLGLNLLDIFLWTKKVQFGMPKRIGEFAYRLKDMNHRFTPFLLGAVTFFLPCGFTQSMQVYTLSSGSFLAGAMTMTAFALGTLPVLALLSFGPLGIRSSAHTGVFFKTVGLIVIAFTFLLSIIFTTATHAATFPFSKAGASGVSTSITVTTTASTASLSLTIKNPNRVTINKKLVVYSSSTNAFTILL
jgi:sulfite exporter TauE/SafE